MDLLKTLDFRSYLNPIGSLLSMSRKKSKPARDHLTVHRSIVKSLQDFYGSDKGLDKNSLKTLLNLGNKGLAAQQELSCEFLQKHASNKHANESLWKEIYAYYWLLSHSYLGLIRQHTEHNKPGEISPILPAVTAYALYYLRHQIKWDYFRKENIKSNMWERVNSLYRMAEHGGFSNEPVQIVGVGSITPGQEYARILLMDLLDPIRLDTIHIEAMDVILENWQGSTEFEKRSSDTVHTHCVDLGSSHGARRISAEIDNDNVRCWNMDNFLKEVNLSGEKIEAIENSDRFKACVMLDRKQASELLEFALKSWQGSGLQPPQLKTSQKALV